MIECSALSRRGDSGLAIRLSLGTSRYVNYGAIVMLLSGVAVAGFPPARGQTPSPDQQAEAALYQEGMRLLHEHSYPQALERFKKLEEASPNLPQGYTGEGIALALSGKLQEAIPVLQKASEIDPSFWVARRELGIIYWQLGAKEKAAKELTAVAKLSPDDTSVNVILGEYNFEFANYQAAVDFFSKARAKVDMNLPLSLMNSEALIKSGHPEQATGELDRLTTTPALDPRQQFRIAWLLGEAGAYDKAIKVFSALPSDYADPVGRDYGIALAYYQGGKYADCIQLLTNLKQRGRARGEVFSLLGAAEEVSGHQPQAEDAFRAGISQFPKEPDNYLNSATLSAKDQNYAAAVTVLTAGTQQIPGNYKLFLNRGVVYSLQGNLQKAQSDFERSVSLAPTEPAPYVGLGICFTDQDQYSSAADVLRKAIHQGLSDVKLNYFLVDALFRQGLTAASPQYQEALTTTEASIGLDPAFPYSYLQRGKLQMMTGHLQEAMDDLEHAQKLDPHSTAIAYQLATAYRLAGRTAESSKLFAQVSNTTKLQDAEFRQSTLIGVMGAISNANYSSR